jgi:hypothetical protein
MMNLGLKFIPQIADYVSACVFMLSLYSSGGPPVDGSGRLGLPNPEFGHTTLEQTYFGREANEIAYSLPDKNALIIDLGGAYGVNTKPIIQMGRPVTLVDRNPLSLAWAHFTTPESLQPLLDLRIAEFPDGMEVEDGSVALTLGMSLLHFAHPRDLKRWLKKIYLWTKPGHYFVGESQTPFLGILKKTGFLAKFVARQKEGEEHPGYLNDPKHYLLDEQLRPVNLATARYYLRLLHEAGFEIIQLGYVPRHDYPTPLLTDSDFRKTETPIVYPLETVGFVAQRPVEERSDHTLPDRLQKMDRSFKFAERTSLKKIFDIH